jgi:ABC-type phosphate transport system permease subunit
MKMKQYINQQVKATFKVLDSIEKVPTNYFFKQKVLQRIQAEQHLKQSVFSWFTTQFQLATLAVFLLLNVSVIFYSFSNIEETSVTDISVFAKEYTLQSSSNSILK